MKSGKRPILVNRLNLAYLMLVVRGSFSAFATRSTLMLPEYQNMLRDLIPFFKTTIPFLQNPEFHYFSTPTFQLQAEQIKLYPAVMKFLMHFSSICINWYLYLRNLFKVNINILYLSLTAQALLLMKSCSNLRFN